MLELPAGESSTFEDLKAVAQKLTTVAENPGAGHNLGNDQFWSMRSLSQLWDTGMPVPDLGMQILHGVQNLDPSLIGTLCQSYPRTKRPLWKPHPFRWLS